MATQKIITSTIIGIDARRKALHYYTMLGEDKTSIVHRVKNYAGADYDEEFFKKLKDAIAQFVVDEPADIVRKVCVVVSDEAVSLDCVRLPALRSPRLIQNALNVKISDIYSNRDKLRVLTYLAEKNKQYWAYNVAAIQRQVISSICGACTENKMPVEALTYAAASTVTAVSALKPAWKNENYLFLDVKDVYTRFIFVVGGRAVGFFALPFGQEYLSAGAYVQEDMLFDHSMGEMTVINARERAKAKRASIREELNGAKETVSLESMLVTNVASDTDDDEDEEEIVVEEEVAETVASNVGKSAYKKIPRRLPKFMQRPIPQTEEEIAKEHFRVLVKWALCLIKGNPTLVSLGAPKFVAVNLPEHMAFIIDALKEEEKENKIPFVRFDGADDDEDTARNLELFGGLYSKNWHSSAKF